MRKNFSNDSSSKNYIRKNDRKADRNAERKPSRFGPQEKTYRKVYEDSTEGSDSFSKKRVGKSLTKSTESYSRPTKKFASSTGDKRSYNSVPRKPVLIKRKVEAVSDGKIRLNRYLANSGICSRREADEYIAAGVVRVNDVIVTEMGMKVGYDDKVHFHSQLVRPEKKVYVLLNKPKNCVTTSDDPQDRLTVLDLVKGATNERIYPVGRLDRNTTGVLLLTNDGDMAAKLTHPKYNKKKIYHVSLDSQLTNDDLTKITNGIELEDGLIVVDEVSFVDDTHKEIGVEIHSGKNRIVRRIFESLGYKIIKLDRVYFAGLTKKNLSRGKWRHLSQLEINMLKMGAFE